MSVNTQDNTFTSTVTSEAASPLVAGVVSYNGLVRIFGTTGINGTSETEIGLMTVPTINDWFSRLNSRGYNSSGPTGDWKGEWWAVHNYLQYGGSCLVGATGSTGDYYASNGVLGITKTPLHNKNLANITVIFDSGNTFSAGAAIDAATTRKDCIAIVGNTKKITGVPAASGDTYTTASKLSDFGFTNQSEFVAYVAGRKKFTAGVGSSVNILEANLSPDVAGCFARSARDATLWTSPAGKTRGRILGVVAMQQTFGEIDADYLYNSSVNPVLVFPGEGTFLMGNKTSYGDTTSALSRLNSSIMISYLKRQLLNSARQYLFEVNDATTRQRVVSSITPILDRVKSGNGIVNYRVVCDTTNNTTATIAENKLVIDVYIQPTTTAETIVITIVNTNTSEAFSS